MLPRSLFALVLPVAMSFPLAILCSEPQAERKELRAGIIGLDTSHAIAFTKLLNDTTAKDHVEGCRVVAAYPKGSPDIESSVSRVPEYTKQVQGMGVEIVQSIDALLESVDVVFLETNDGRPHLEQVRNSLLARIGVSLLFLAWAVLFLFLPDVLTRRYRKFSTSPKSERIAP